MVVILNRYWIKTTYSYVQQKRPFLTPSAKSNPSQDLISCPFQPTLYITIRPKNCTSLKSIRRKYRMDLGCCQSISITVQYRLDCMRKLLLRDAAAGGGGGVVTIYIMDIIYILSITYKYSVQWTFRKHTHTDNRGEYSANKSVSRVGA